MATQTKTCVSVNDSLESRRRHQRFKNAYQQNGFERQAAAWREAASRLSDWAQANMVNRSDVHGAYLPLMARTDPKKKAVTKREQVTSDLLARHFAGADHGDLIGLHTTSLDNTSLYRAIDIDSRGGNAKEDTWLAAHSLMQRLEDLGFHVLLLDSDGLGGFHLLLIFESPVATELLYEFGRWLLRTTDMPSLASAPEVFPKQPSLKPGQIGNWLRLPGRHHTHEHWTGVWNGFRWLFGEEAIQRILESETNTESQIPDLEDEDEPETNSTKWELKQIAVDFPLEHSLNLVLSRLKGQGFQGVIWAF